MRPVWRVTIARYMPASVTVAISWSPPGVRTRRVPFSSSPSCLARSLATISIESPAA
nr:MAG TPA: hypothetical protein [Caudoviricetes sp.]